ncbi:MAG: hypothetical protein N2450_05205 [bacterium]|nr:hypothetical protein [bacterium]
MSGLRSDNVNEVLKIILLLAIGIALLGILLWYISSWYPLYMAKKEVQMALKDFANAYNRYAATADEPVTITYMTQTKNWVILDKETKQHWSFELLGNPAHTVEAQSLPSMPGGRDRFVYIDIATGLLWGWGIPATQDSIESGLIPRDKY